MAEIALGLWIVAWLMWLVLRFAAMKRKLERGKEVKRG